MNLAESLRLKEAMEGRVVKARRARWRRALAFVLRVLFVDLPLFTLWVLAGVLVLVSLLEHHWGRAVLTALSVVYVTRMYGEILQTWKGGPHARAGRGS